MNTVLKLILSMSFSGGLLILVLFLAKRFLKDRISRQWQYYIWLVAVLRLLPKAIWVLTGALTLCVVLGAAFVGVYPIAAASGQPSDESLAAVDGAGNEAGNGTEGGTGSGADGEAGDGTGNGTNGGAGNGTGNGAGTSAHGKDYDSQAERYYEAGSLPMFQIVFSRLDEAAQDKWLDKIYTDNQIAFWGAAVGQLDEDCALIQRYADRIYKDDNIAFFSTLAMHMSEDMLERWLDKALEDEKVSFQSMLFNALDRDKEYDELKEQQEKEWEEALAAEYRAVGVTMEGKEYYYQGQLVNIFLDIRPGKAFYTLNLNPSGTVNIKILRDGDNKITGVAYMTEAEVAELLEDMGDDDEDSGSWDDEDWDDDNWGYGGWDDEDWDDGDWQKNASGRTWHPQVIPVSAETVADGDIVWLGEYTLSEGDRIWYAVYAETGNGMQIGFAKPGDERLNQVYYSVHSLRQGDESLKCIADFTLRPLAEPGTYHLFLRATDGNLGNVTGSVSIGFVADAHPIADQTAFR